MTSKVVGIFAKKTLNPDLSLQHMLPPVPDDATWLFGLMHASLVLEASCDYQG